LLIVCVQYNQIYLNIEEHQKIRQFQTKSVCKCAPDDLFIFASDDVMPGKQTTKQPVEC